FGTMAARAAVRDAGRVLEVPYGVVDKIAKLIPEGPGQNLEDCLKPGSELKQSYDSDPVTREIVDLARTLEGLTRPDSIHAAGVFQFESSGMRDALRQVKPTVFEDLIALVALYRPGPMQYIPVYARRKAGQEPVGYPDERLKAILHDTYGICLTGDSLVFDANT